MSSGPRSRAARYYASGSVNRRTLLPLVFADSVGSR